MSRRGGDPACGPYAPKLTCDDCSLFLLSPSGKSLRRDTDGVCSPPRNGLADQRHDGGDRGICIPSQTFLGEALRSDRDPSLSFCQARSTSCGRSGRHYRNLPFRQRSQRTSLYFLAFVNGSEPALSLLFPTAPSALNGGDVASVQRSCQART